MASLGATSEMVNAVTLKTALTAVVSGLDYITTIKKRTGVGTGGVFRWK